MGASLAFFLGTVCYLVIIAFVIIAFVIPGPKATRKKEILDYARRAERRHQARLRAIKRANESEALSRARAEELVTKTPSAVNPQVVLPRRRGH